MRLTVNCDGAVVLTTPYGVGQSLIEKFINDKKQWLWSKIQYFKSVDYKPVRSFSRKDYLQNKQHLGLEKINF